jgi:predicted metalloprotease with PDZ domain
MGDLSKRFGRDKSFQDDELFDIITSMTYPEIGGFLQTYVAGKKPLPLDSIFRLAGINFQPSDTVYAPEIDFGTGVNFGLVPTGDTLYVANLSKPSNLMKRIGVNSGDKILELNGKSFLLSNYKLAIEAYGEEAKVGSTISLKVLRKNKEGSNQWEEKLLSATIRNESKVEATLKPDLNATTKQKSLLENWLSKN